MNTSQEPSKTEKFKKSTARFVRSEINKTASSIVTMRVLMLEIGFAVAVGITASYGYILYIMK